MKITRFGHSCMLVEEAIDFAVAVKPKICFPVHDGLLKHLTAYHNIPPKYSLKRKY